MIYIIRFLQILLAGVIPSALSTEIIRHQPNTLLWLILCLLSFIIFITVNSVFNIAIYRVVKGDIREYLRINLIVYAVYVIFTVIIYKFTDAMVFSFLCANLRGFERLLVKTRYTVSASHIIAVIFTVVLPFFIRKHDERAARIRAEQEIAPEENVGLLIDINSDEPAPDDPFADDDDDFML